MAENLIPIYELDELLGMDKGTAYRLLLKTVYSAHKVHNVWRLRESEIAGVCDRILRYRNRLPFYPAENMSIAEAADAMQVTQGAIYAMGRRGEIEWAENELWKMPVRGSVVALCRRKGLRVPA